MLKVGPIIMVDSFFRASVLGKALGLTAQAVISHCLTEKHLLIMTADPECLWAYLKVRARGRLGFIKKMSATNPTVLCIIQCMYKYIVHNT